MGITCPEPAGRRCWVATAGDCTSLISSYTTQNSYLLGHRAPATSHTFPLCLHPPSGATPHTCGPHQWYSLPPDTAPLSLSTFQNHLRDGTEILPAAAAPPIPYFPALDFWLSRTADGHWPVSLNFPGRVQPPRVLSWLPSNAKQLEATALRSTNWVTSTLPARMLVHTASDWRQFAHLSHPSSWSARTAPRSTALSRRHHRPSLPQLHRSDSHLVRRPLTQKLGRLPSDDLGLLVHLVLVATFYVLPAYESD